MSEARTQDLEERHRLGRQEYRRRLESIQAVCDDIRQTRLELARIWLAEHYPLENITVKEAASSLESISMGFHMEHESHHGSPPTRRVQLELIAYFDTIGGFNKFTE